MSTVMPELRTPVMIVVDASWESEAGKLQTVRARMEDKSAGGACIRVKTPIPVGHRVDIEWRFDRFSGIVKYCRKEEREFLVGIQRDSVPARLKPQTTPLPIERKLEVEAKPGRAVQSDDELRKPLNGPQESDEPSRPRIERINRQSPRLRYQTNAALPVSMPAREPRSRLDLHRPDDVSASERQFSNASRRINRRVEKTPRAMDPNLERKTMGNKWLGLAPWRNKPVEVSSESHAAKNRESDKEITMPYSTPHAEKPSPSSAREVPDFQIELLPMEDIYRASGIIGPRRGYGVNKVVEMLESEHIRSLSKEMKRAAVLMALDAAEVSVDVIQLDANARQAALDSYEADQKKQAEAEWARKAEEMAQIQAELESIKAHYMARIHRNTESIARDKARFSGWVATKQKESQSMAEALELCLKAPATEPAKPQAPEVGMTAASSAS